MKKLPITKEAFEKSRYFKNKYGELEYVSESGKLFKTNKGKILKFKESKVDLERDKPNSPDFKSWSEVEREIRAAIKYAERKGQEACTVFDIGTWDQRNNKTLQEIIAKFKAKGYSCRPYSEEGSGYGSVDDGLGLSIVWGSFLESSKSTKKFGKKFTKEGTESNPRFKCMEGNREYDDDIQAFKHEVADALKQQLDDGYIVEPGIGIIRVTDTIKGVDFKLDISVSDEVEM